MTGSPVVRRSGPAAALHAMQIDGTGGRQVVIMAADGPAVVMGSTQDDRVVDRAAAERLGVQVARRRSGGGAVWVAPGDPLWVDVVVPRDDPLWRDDVHGSFGPIGRAWQRALASVGVGETSVHDGPLVRSRWSELVCFAGVGPGEVLRGGGKLVGISQRRTRTAARFQCALPIRWDPAPLCAVLADRPPVDELRDVGAGLGDVPTDRLVEALVDELAVIDLS